MSGYGLMSLEREKEEIDRLVFDIGFQYINDADVRVNFFATHREIVEGYLDEYRYGRADFSHAMGKLHDHYSELNNELNQLQMGSVKLFAIVKRERDASSLATLSLKGVGFAGGAFQIVGGFGTCFKDIRSACAKLGIPLMVQGAENFYENIYYLFTHEEPKDTPVRDAYRYIARILGSDDTAGDIAFSAVDIGLSLGSMGILTRREEARKLFYHIREDFIRGWQGMGAAGISTEIAGNASSSFNIYKILSQPETNWSEINE